MNRKRNSQWRNWLINACFLAAGLMIGAKMVGGNSQPARDTEGLEKSQLVETQDARPSYDKLTGKQSELSPAQVVDADELADDDEDADDNSVFRNNDRTADLDEPIYDDFAEAQAVKASKYNKASEREANDGNQSEGSSKSAKTQIAKKDNTKGKRELDAGPLTKDDMVVRKKTVADPAANEVAADKKGNKSLWKEDDERSAQRKTKASTKQVAKPSQPAPKRTVTTPRSKARQQPVTPSQQIARPQRRRLPPQRASVQPEIATPRPAESSRPAVIPPQRIAAPRSPQPKPKSPRRDVVRPERSVTSSQRVASPSPSVAPEQQQRSLAPTRTVTRDRVVAPTQRAYYPQRVASPRRVEQIPLGPAEIRRVEPATKQVRVKPQPEKKTSETDRAPTTHPVRETKTGKVENELDRLRRALEQLSRDR